MNYVLVSHACCNPMRLSIRCELHHLSVIDHAFMERPDSRNMLAMACDRSAIRAPFVEEEKVNIGLFCAALYD